MYGSVRGVPGNRNPYRDPYRIGIIIDNLTPFDSTHHHMMQGAWSIQPCAVRHFLPPYVDLVNSVNNVPKLPRTTSNHLIFYVQWSNVDLTPIFLSSKGNACQEKMSPRLMPQPSVMKQDSEDLVNILVSASRPDIKNLIVQPNIPFGSTDRAAF